MPAPFKGRKVRLTLSDMPGNPLQTACCLLLLTSAGTLRAEETWDLCHAWTPPTLSYPLSESGEKAATLISADSMESSDNDTFKLSGNIFLQRPEEQLRADQATYYKSRNLIDASGNVVFETANMSAEGAAAHLDTNQHTGHFDDAEFFLYNRHARGSSSHIELQGEEMTILKQASYTTCDKGDNGWALRASTVKLNHASGMGDAYNMRLYFQDVPFFYFPYMRFPITDARMTGLLPPSFGSSREGGNEISQPIYLNLHPQLDDTLTPHNYTARGMKWENEFRYLSHYGEGLFYSERIDDQVYDDQRFLVDYRHSGKLGAGWSSNILYSNVSDGDYFNDFGNSLSATSKSYLERRLRLNYSDPHQQFAIQAQDFLLLDETLPATSLPYKRQPQLTHELTPVGMGPMRFEMESEIVQFQRDNSITGKRADFHPALSLPYERSAGYIIPKLSLYQTYYELDAEHNTLGYEKRTRSVPVNSLDSGIYLERDTNIGSGKYLQTLEPRLFYLYVPYRAQNDLPLFDTGEPAFSAARLFSENRFSGLDRIGDTRQVTLSLTTRLLESDSGKERFYATVGKIAYLEDRRVGLKSEILDKRRQSDIILESQFRPLDPLSFKASFIWNTEYDTITTRDFRIQYLSDNRHIINMRYREIGNRVTDPDNIKQEIDASLLWPLTPRWSIMARRYHSLPDDRTLEQMAGFEYDSCCWAFRAVRHATFVNDPDAVAAPFGKLSYRWYMQIELKGLTSLGKRIDEYMQDRILGFNAVN
jgi:LPS-assembly protein